MCLLNKYLNFFLNDSRATVWPDKPTVLKLFLGLPNIFLYIYFGQNLIQKCQTVASWSSSHSLWSFKLPETVATKVGGFLWIGSGKAWGVGGSAGRIGAGSYIFGLRGYEKFRMSNQFFQSDFKFWKNYNDIYNSRIWRPRIGRLRFLRNFRLTETTDLTKPKPIFIFEKPRDDYICDHLSEWDHFLGKYIFIVKIVQRLL